MQPAYQRLILSQRPALYWQFGEGASTAHDRATGTYTGTISSAGTPVSTGPSLVAGNVSGSILFAGGGNSGVVQANSYDSLSNSVARTYTGWAQRSVTTNYHCLYNFDNASGDSELMVPVTDRDVELRINYTGGGLGVDRLLWTSAWPTTGITAHFALVLDTANDRAELYINGVSKGAQTITKNFPAFNTGFMVGHSSYSGSWEGYLSQFATFHRGLTASEIQAQAKAGVFN